MKTIMDNFLNSQDDLNFLNGTMGKKEHKDKNENIGETGKEEAPVSDDITNAPETEVVYTLQKIIEELNRSEQTVRKYTEQFPDFIKPSSDKNGQIFFSEHDLRVMRTISNLKRQKKDIDSIRDTIKTENAIQKTETNQGSITQGSNAGQEELAATISLRIKEQLSSYFENELLKTKEQLCSYFENETKDIFIRLDNISNAMSEISDLQNRSMLSVSNQENLMLNIKKEVEKNKDAVTDLQRNIASKIDRSANKFETSINKLQTTAEQSNDTIVNDIKNRLSQNLDSINAMQKDIEKLRSSNINRKVDDLEKTIQESLDKEKQQLISLIEEAMTPPEYHPEDTAEYKELNENFEKNKEALQKARSAVDNMGRHIEEQDEKMQEKDRQISTQVAQIATLTTHLHRIKSEYERLKESMKPVEYIPANPERNFSKELAEEAFPEQEKDGMKSPSSAPAHISEAGSGTANADIASAIAPKKKKRFFFF